MAEFMVPARFEDLENAATDRLCVKEHTNVAEMDADATEDLVTGGAPQ